MSNTSLWLNLAVFLSSLGGFILLALASERQGEFLLHREPSARERLLFRLIGWPLLALALILCFAGWGWSIGAVSWLGWLTMAGAGLSFYLPWWPWQEKKPVRARPAPVAKAAAPKAELASASASAQSGSIATPAKARLGTSPRNVAFAVSLLAIPAAFLVSVSQSGPAPIYRPDAVQGQIGPWSFVLAETDSHPPAMSRNGTHTKAFHIRFCDSCDTDIRSAYLHVNKPQNTPSAKQAFGGVRWTRSVDLAIPKGSELEHQLWLSVESKNGEIFHHAMDFHQAAPATAAFLQQGL